MKNDNLEMAWSSWSPLLASVAGVRVGLAALEKLGIKRSGGTQLYGIVEIGEDHGGMCFGDGVQYANGCTFGKAISKIPLGKLGFPGLKRFQSCCEGGFHGKLQPNRCIQIYEAGSRHFPR
jgi:hypothetical protein